MAKKEKTAVTVNDKEYYIEDMNDKQKTLVNHCADLNRKIETMLFNVDQLRVGKEAFDNMLIKELEQPEVSEAS